ncbi:MAG: hypothetical protein AB1403_10450, partial [Candidatus Riflebacteria bacterium]
LSLIPCLFKALTIWSKSIASFCSSCGNIILSPQVESPGKHPAIEEFTQQKEPEGKSDVTEPAETRLFPFSCRASG